MATQEDIFPEELTLFDYVEKAPRIDISAQKLKERIPIPKNRSEEWKETFPRYPSCEDGYLKAFSPQDHESYIQALKKYGFCVIQYLDPKSCDLTVKETFED